MNTPDTATPEERPDEESGVTDVRRVREAIARQHGGNIPEHAAESTRIAESLREKLRLGPFVSPPPRTAPRSGTGG